MKILLPVDGSAHSDAVVHELVRRPWPADTEVEIFSAAYAAPEFIDPQMVGQDVRMKSMEWSLARARENVAEAAEEIGRGAASLKVTTKVVQGPPKDAILDEAANWGADLIMLGSHGYGAALRLLLGSVSHAVALHAPCSVEIVRGRKRDV